MNSISKQKGFTIVELLIVVVVIAILAAITIVSYNGIKGSAEQSKIASDVSTLQKAILAARNAKGEVTLLTVTGSGSTGANCWARASGTDLATLPKTDLCWSAYDAALNKISAASDINVRNLIDPWGRPYYIDENEGEGAGCTPDRIGVYARPFTTGQTMVNTKQIALIQPTC